MTARTGHTASTGQQPTWALAVPDPGCGWLSANHRTHWATKAAGVRAWRTSAHQLARAARLPRLDRAHVLVTFHHATARRRDAMNLSPTAKAVIDGLIDAGLLTDDDDTRLTGPDLRTGPPVPRGRPVHLDLLITALHPDLQELHP